MFKCYYLFLLFDGAKVYTFYNTRKFLVLKFC
nr:MAG TPA: hypothetical protein [Caudoviricetes sp.]